MEDHSQEDNLLQKLVSQFIRLMLELENIYSL